MKRRLQQDQKTEEEEERRVENYGDEDSDSDSDSDSDNDCDCDENDGCDCDEDEDDDRDEATAATIIPARKGLTIHNFIAMNVDVEEDTNDDDNDNDNSNNSNNSNNCLWRQWRQWRMMRTYPNELFFTAIHNKQLTRYLHKKARDEAKWQKLQEEGVARAAELQLQYGGEASMVEKYSPEAPHRLGFVLQQAELALLQLDTAEAQLNLSNTVRVCLSNMICDEARRHKLQEEGAMRATELQKEYGGKANVVEKYSPGAPHRLGAVLQHVELAILELNAYSQIMLDGFDRRQGLC